MAQSNKERVGRALDALLPELRKYVEQELRDVYADKWDQHLTAGDGAVDVPRLCNTIVAEWDSVFEVVLSKDTKGLVHAFGRPETSMPTSRFSRLTTPCPHSLVSRNY